jgi:hypothetical protein
MTNINFELSDIETQENEIEVSSEGIDLILSFIKNSFDGYLYMKIMDIQRETLLSYTRCLPLVDYFILNKQSTNFDKRLLFIKTNDSAKEKDLITSDNINKDYKLFII